MDSTLRNASCEANVRIVAVALIAGIVVVLAGLNARVGSNFSNGTTKTIQSVINISQQSADVIGERGLTR